MNISFSKLWILVVQKVGRIVNDPHFFNKSQNIIKQVDLKAEISETLIEYLQNRHHGLVPLQYEHSQNRIKIY